QSHRSYLGQQGVSGPLRSCLEQLKKPWWREPTPLVLQHSETARLAIDAFLEQGERGYLGAIAGERELPFLSHLDMEYMSQQRSQSFPDPSSVKDKEAEPSDEDAGDASSLNSELTSGTYFPLMSDVHPPELELGWPGTPLLSVAGHTQATVVFQRNKANSIKDLLRSLISRARTVIAIVMDLFTDMEILCDLLEASSRRHVPVYLILDEENLKHFVEMCNKMALTQDNFPNMRVRCLAGDTYYSKAGKKFAGQVLEKFILIDCDQVLAGTYSFTWLCSQVHTSLATHFRGQIVAEFEKEFRSLYAESRAVSSFCLPGPGACPSAQGTPKAASSLLKPTQVNNTETSSPSSSLSNVSIRSIKMSPFLKNSSCNTHQEKQDSGSDPGTRKGNEDVSLRPAGPKQQGEPPDSRSSPPNKPSPALYHKPNLLTPRTFLQAEPSPAPSSSKAAHQGSSKATSSPCSPRRQEQTPQTRSDGASSNGTSTKQKGPPVPCYEQLPEDVLMEKTSAYGAEKRMTLGHSKLDLITKYNKLKSKHIHSRFEL
ncbi:Protein FAM83C, partial [Chaetura pelagica]